MAIAALLHPTNLPASTTRILHRFAYGNGGWSPFAALTLDSSGDLYGTTEAGGQYGHGVVFRLTPASKGWKETIVHAFGQENGGWYPDAAVVFNSRGDLFGTTTEGGPEFEGTVFELVHESHGRWTERVLDGFSLYSENIPEAPVVFDAEGNLFGTTKLGGAYGDGVVFEMKPPEHKGGQWSESVIYNFTFGNDGAFPESALVLDRNGNLYGASYFAGIHDNGTVYELKRTKAGWKEITLYEFQGGSDGSNPTGPLTWGPDGSLYGTTEVGGIRGTVFKLTPAGNGWQESILYRFKNGNDGGHPLGAVAFDKAGNLYGTSSMGGLYGDGTAFKLAPDGHGGWTESVLHSFNGTDGSNPTHGVIIDSQGNLFGTTNQGGGNCNCGVVFEIIP
jgi:uncharacterized repeat protein (TIGR03803 family)